MTSFETPPRASILIESLRDIGYTLETALADIIDNSVAAGAKQVDILTDSSGDEFRIAVIDDGHGMSEADLRNAMRLGSKHPSESRDKSDLGRFGLGMKTASFSQCRRLTVVSRTKGATSCAIWDLDRVAKTDRWVLDVPESVDAIPFVKQLGSSGTLILWEKLDRILEYDGDMPDQRNFNVRIDSATRHLELIFHRYMEGERGRPKVTMRLNRRVLEPFDPFNKSKSERGPEENIAFGAKRVKVQPFTLPPHQRVSDAEWRKYEGARGYLREQGFYLYRARRLIVRGTWFHLARQQELTKLARISVDIPTTMDSEWRIDVLKSQAQPPKPVRERLRKIVETLTSPSRRAYTRRGAVLTSVERHPAWIREQVDGQIHYKVNRGHPVVQGLASQLSDLHQAELDGLTEFLEASLPFDAIYADFGNDPNAMARPELSDAALEAAVGSMYEHLVTSGLVSFDDFRTTLQSIEPFKSSWGRVEKLLKTDSPLGRAST